MATSPKFKTQLFPPEFWELTKSQKNKYQFNFQQREEITRIRTVKTPKEIAEILGVGVYKIHKVVKNVPKKTAEQKFLAKEKRAKTKNPQLYAKIQQYKLEQQNKVNDMAAMAAEAVVVKEVDVAAVVDDLNLKSLPAIKKSVLAPKKQSSKEKETKTHTQNLSDMQWQLGKLNELCKKFENAPQLMGKKPDKIVKKLEWTSEKLEKMINNYFQQEVLKEEQRRVTLMKKTGQSEYDLMMTEKSEGSPQ
jgi:hypothetical protein